LKLKGWFKSTAASLEGHVSQIREGAALAAQELADGVQKGIVASKVHFSEERLDVIFIERALGLELDLAKGAVVRGLKPGGQGERLQVQPQDRLVAICGTELPVFEEMLPTVFIEEVQGRMKSMGRPCTLTFVRLVEVAAPEGEGGDQFFDGLKKLHKKIPGGFVGERDVPSAELLAELEAARDLARRFELEAQEAREEAKLQADDAIAAVEEAAQLRADLAEWQLSKVWNAQEAQRSVVETEAARTVVAEARERVADSDIEVERLREERNLLDERMAAQMRSAEAQAAEVERLRSCLSSAEASAGEAQQLRQGLESRLEEAQRQIGEVEARQAERAMSEAAALAAAEELRLSAGQQRDAASEELQAAEAREASEHRRAEDLVAELEAVKAEAPRWAAAERLVPELRREVERLRKEVLLFQSASGSGDGGGAMADAESRIGELTREVEQLRGALRQQEEAARAAAVAVPVVGIRAPTPEVEWEQVPSPDRADEAAPETADAADGSANANGAVEEGAAVANGAAASAAEAQGRALPPEKALEVKVAELEASNAALLRQLNSRPIVFQFAPNPEDDEDADLDEPPAEDEDPLAPDPERPPAASSMPPRTPLGSPPRGLSGSSGSGGPVGGGQPHAVGGGAGGGVAVVFGSVVWLRRRCWRTFVACRKQRATQSLERQLRTFTRRMLQSPVLLWLFYVHVLVLWFLEGWRQAVSQTLPMDPTGTVISQADVVVAAPSSLPPMPLLGATPHV